MRDEPELDEDDQRRQPIHGVKLATSSAFPLSEHTRLNRKKNREIWVNIPLAL